MKSVAAQISIVFLLIVLAAGKDTVVTLDSDSYNAFVESHDNVLVKFFSPGCHFCQELAPHFVEAATLLETELPSVVFAEADVIDNPRIGRQLKLKGVPTVIYFKKQTPIRFTGHYTTEDLIAFVRECYANSGETVEEMMTTDHVKDLKTMISSHPLTLVAYLPENANAMTNIVNEATSEMVNLTRRVITDKRTAEAMGASIPSLILYKGLESKTAYDGRFTSTEIRHWLLAEELPLIVPYTPFFSKKAFNKDLGVSVYILFFAPEQNPTPRATEQRRILEKIALRYRGRIVVLHIPAENPRLLDYFGIREWQVPTIGLLAYEKGGNKKYRLKEEMSESSVIRLIEGYFHGELSPFLRSEEEPEEQTTPVLTLVGSSFERMVNDATRDMVVRFFASFDGKSKDLEPVFEEVAASYLMDRTIAFAEMDVTKNEAEGVSSFDFPRVILYRAGGHGKDTAEYKGEFETEALKAFVEENRAHHAADAEEL